MQAKINVDTWIYSAMMAGMNEIVPVTASPVPVEMEISELMEFPLLRAA
jgi:hypothetical protein